MPFETQPRLFRSHAAAIVYYLDESLAGVLDKYADIVCIGVHRIL